MSETTSPSALPQIITKSQAVWREGHLFDAGPEGRTHLIDADSKIAPGPVETLLNALATCSGVDVVDILAKRRTPIAAMTVGVTGHRRGEQPRRVMRIEMEFRISGDGIDRVHAERAISLAIEKYCSVAASLGTDIPIETRLVLNGA